jgi:4-hydroxythreonine-4-phosphate dehydrogenase
MKQNSPVLAITPGEPAGIGPEILLKFCIEYPATRLVAVADPDLLRQTASTLGIDLEVREWRPAMTFDPGVLACLPVKLKTAALPGVLNPQNAEYVLETLRQAVAFVQDGQAGALVTGPVHKGVINESGIPFTGHTEFLAQLAGVPQVVMMLATRGLRVTLATTHLPLRGVADALTSEKLEGVIRITHQALHSQLDIRHPRLQVLGLNPHAGEGGHLGSEEIDIIIPLINRLKTEGMLLDGPVPADTAFSPDRIAQCDAVVAMYHDQGLPVLKHMGFGRAVNITLGLPFIRTSVDHGTALDLAGKGKADNGSLHEAILTAASMAMHQPASGQ